MTTINLIRILGNSAGVMIAEQPFEAGSAGFRA